jgi:hypothetical protein
MAGTFNSLAYLPDGSPVAAYSLTTVVGNHTYTDLIASYRDATGWHQHVVDATGTQDQAPSMVVDSLGNIHIAYMHTDDAGMRSLRIASGSGDNWTYDTLGYPIGDLFYGNPDMAVDGSGNLHLTWSDGGSGTYGDGGVYYATATVPEPPTLLLTLGALAAMLGRYTVRRRSG